MNKISTLIQQNETNFADVLRGGDSVDDTPHVAATRLISFP